MLTASALATPAEEITSALAVNGPSDASQTRAREFVKAFNAVALRISPRALPEYVAAAINLRPALAPNIVAVAIKAAVKNLEAKPDALFRLIQQIVKVAVAANPDTAASITRAAVSVSPDSRRCILEAAVSAAPDNKDAISEAANLRTQPFAFLTFSASDLSGFSFTPATLNPANISDLGGDTSVNSPEQPPSSH
ncbi:MAG TPA: hypothetical protein VGH00_07805 [Chthoniobacterales bacterium]